MHLWVREAKISVKSKHNHRRVSHLVAVSTFVEHPNNDEAVLVTSCQFFILLIPSDHLY